MWKEVWVCAALILCILHDSIYQFLKHEECLRGIL